MREQLIGALVANGVDIRIFGPWRRKLGERSPLRSRLEHGFFTPQRMAEIFAACKATLNIHTWRGRFDYGLNPRVFEAAACGVPQLVDHKRELDELFDETERAAMLVYRQRRGTSHSSAAGKDLAELRAKAARRVRVDS